MKALILAAGRGMRMRPYTYSAPKHMLPIANKPLLEYAVEGLKNAGIKDIGMVVGYKKEQIMGYFGNGRKFGVNIQYINQIRRLGVAHAIAVSRGFIGNEPFMVLLGDNIFRDDIKRLIREHERSGAEASIGVQKVKDPRRFGVAILKGKRIVKIIEKPKKPPTKLATVGVYFFSSSKVFSVIEMQKKSKRGEYDIADTYMELIRRGEHVNAIRVRKRWKDTGQSADMLEANKTILAENGGKMVEKGVRMKNTRLVAPVIIGKGCIINNCVIGPYVSVGDNCNLANTRIENSIICRGCSIDYKGEIVNSIIGRFCSLKKRNSKKMSFYIGDYSKISEVDSKLKC